MMTYEQTLNYIYERLPMFSRTGAGAIKSGFKNIRDLCILLGNPQLKTRFIHIAGTNGKGSVSHMLAAILQTQGYKTGLYTSPHLTDFRERIRINGQMIPEEYVVRFIDKLSGETERIRPSFFEITVAMAFDYFAAQEVDFAIIETGLGGRLDSTNIIQPELAVITNIGYDHMQLLGDTLPEIAGEKAGIIKEGIPVVIGETHEATAHVFLEKAAMRTAPITFADVEFQVANWNYEEDQLSVEISKKDTVDHFRYQLDLPGVYQAKNLLTVLEACRQLVAKGIALEKTNIVKGLAHARRLTGLQGRWELIHRRPNVILDVAHNEDGIQQLLHQLELTAFRKLHIVLGMVKDKDVEKALSLLPPAARYYFTNAGIPRALPGGDLKRLAEKYELEGDVYDNVNHALQHLITSAHTDDLVLICGSVFLVGEVNRSLLK